MDKLKATFDSNETQRVGKIIGENLKKFNESKIGAYHFKPFSIYITNDEENIIGGLKGEIFEKVCMIQTVWVHEAERKRGLGSMLFKKLEEFAKESTCKIIQLDSAEFQAKQFYEKIGFSVVATLPENFKGYTTYILRKILY